MIASAWTVQDLSGWITDKCNNWKPPLELHSWIRGDGDMYQRKEYIPPPQKKYVKKVLGREKEFMCYLLQVKGL